MCFRNSVTNSKAGRPFNSLARSEFHKRRHCCVFQPHIGETAASLRAIKIDLNVSIKNSGLQLYSAMEKSLLERLQRVCGIGHSVVHLALRRSFNTKSSSRDSSDRVPVSRQIPFRCDSISALSKLPPPRPTDRLLPREAVGSRGVVRSQGRLGAGGRSFLRLPPVSSYCAPSVGAG
jgi:hypothetical protein